MRKGPCMNFRNSILVFPTDAFYSSRSINHLTWSHFFAPFSQEIYLKRCWHPFHRQQDSVISPKPHFTKVLTLETQSASLDSKTIHTRGHRKETQVHVSDQMGKHPCFFLPLPSSFSFYALLPLSLKNILSIKINN